MIRNSYIFLPGISEKGEQNIWNQGIRSWDDFLSIKEIKGISKARKIKYDYMIKEARSKLNEDDSSYFCDKLESKEMWRLYNFFKEDAVFLDIETSGVESGAYITIIGLFDGINTKVMVRNMNLDFDNLREELKKYKIIVTFNGSRFDIPFLSKKCFDLFPDIPQIDLRTMCSKAGLKGGLKDIERELGVKRQNKIVERMYGGDPFLLWRMFLGSGDDHYLRLLVEYNEEDCINLKQIANISYDKIKRPISSC